MSKDNCLAGNHLSSRACWSVFAWPFAPGLATNLACTLPLSMAFALVRVLPYFSAAGCGHARMCNTSASIGAAKRADLYSQRLADEETLIIASTSDVEAGQGPRVAVACMGWQTLTVVAGMRDGFATAPHMC
jgi:hypothetical protein